MDHELAPLLRALRSGSIDPSEHLHRVRARIEDVDGQVHAFVPEDGRWERVGHEVETLRAKYAATAPEDRPPLFGVQVAVKDIIDVDGLPTCGGSAVPADVLTGPEASVVTRLRDAGAVVTGKTVTAEFAYRAPGPTRNPHALDHTPGGSSSGSAAAVAAGMSPLAVGSQTIGSVIRPAAFCGVVGFKPSYGRIPRDGVLLNAPSFDTLGLFTTDVEGMAEAAATVCDEWDVSRVREARSVRPVLGVPALAYLDQAGPHGSAAFRRQLDALTAAGYEVRNSTLLDDIDEINERHQIINLVELARVHEAWFAAYGTSYRAETVEGIRLGQAIDEAAYARARQAHAGFRALVEAEMARRGIDVWISPSAPGPAPASRATTGDAAMNLPWSHAGLPAVTLPADRVPVDDDLLPLGLQCVARFGADEELLGWADDLAATVT